MSRADRQRRYAEFCKAMEPKTDEQIAAAEAHAEEIKREKAPADLFTTINPTE